MGVSPISLKKNRCSRHFRPMERSAGSRRRSFANLDRINTGRSEKRNTTDRLGWESPKQRPRLFTSSIICAFLGLPALLIRILLFAISLQRRVDPLSQQLHLTGVGQTLGILGKKKQNRCFSCHSRVPQDISQVTSHTSLYLG